MGLLHSLEQFLTSKHPVQQVDLKEITCRPRANRKQQCEFL